MHLLETQMLHQERGGSASRGPHISERTDRAGPSIKKKDPSVSEGVFERLDIIA